MMSFEHEQMNNYTDINPYQLIYCNMNFRINQASSKETAENVVRQIGYLHNAIGYVFKDLIKILSYSYPDHPPQNAPQNNKPSPYVARQQINMPNKQAMDIEFQVEPQVKQVEVRAPKGKQKMVSQEKEKVGNVYGEQIEQQKPPNTNIFDQYAYSKQIPIDNNKNKDISSIKQGVARIIEGVKKKKGGEAKDKNSKEVALSPKKNNGDYTFNDKTEKKTLNINGEANPLNDFLDKQMEPNKQADIFSEFIYKNKPSPISKPVQQMQSAQTNIIQRNQQQDESRLWQFLKQKEQPPIYEISDDQD